MERGVLVISAKEKVRLLPALNIPMPLLERAVHILERGLLRRTGGHMNTFKGRDFLKLLDFTPAEIGALLDLFGRS